MRTRTSRQPRWLPRTFGDRTYERMNLDHPDVRKRVMEEVSSDVPVYYDREWPMTVRFCEWLVRNPGHVAGRRVVVVGAGVGLEAVVVAELADRVWVNDMAPVALELQVEQLAHNGVADPGVLPGSFGDLRLPDGAELVVGCYVLYDDDSAAAMRALAGRCRPAGVPLLLADADIGGHFSALLQEAGGGATPLAEDGKLRIGLFG